MNLVIIGPPGSGKGTQASRIARELGLIHLAPGDIFREFASRGTELGKRIRGYLEKGELVPDEIVNSVIKGKLSEVGRKGFILDGYPRTVNQAICLEKILSELGLRLDAVILLEVSEEEVVKRISLRRVCLKCGAVYHLINNPPKSPGKCDRCGGMLYQREDDREEVVRERIRVYEERTKPVIKYYEDKGLLIRVDGSKGIYEVHEEILSKISEIHLESSDSKTNQAYLHRG